MTRGAKPWEWRKDNEVLGERRTRSLGFLAGDDGDGYTTCPICGRKFEPEYASRKYCGVACRDAAGVIRARRNGRRAAKGAA